MGALLSDFRSELRDHLLDTVWQQWTSAGLSGRVDAGSDFVVDPEALLLFTCTIGRHDPRLLDGALEWLDANGDFINVQRLNRIAEEERFSGKAVLRALAAVTRTSKSQAKWSALADAHPGPNVESEPLFYRRSGGALPIVREPDPVFAGYGLIRDAFEGRGIAGGFRPERTANLILRLRAFLGVNARCEILSYLLLNHAGSPRAVASDCYFFPATVSKAMAEMGRSGFLVSRTEGRRKLYQLFPDGWSHLFFADDARPPWVVWPRVFSALERVWLLVSDPQLAEKPAAEQASALRRLLVDGVIDQFERGRPGFAFGDIAAHTGEALIPFSISRLRSLLTMSP